MEHKDRLWRRLRDRVQDRREVQPARLGRVPPELADLKASRLKDLAVVRPGWVRDIDWRAWRQSLVQKRGGQGECTSS